METRKSQDRSKVLLITIIIVLLIMNGFFIYHYVNTDKELTVTTEELVEVEDARNEIDSILKETMAQVEELKGQTQGMDSLLIEKTKEIQAKAAEIELLLKDRKKLGVAREELEKLRYYVKKYQSEIAALTEKNEKLQKQNKEIQETLNQERGKTENLTMKTIALESW
ncbi:MAG: hypothetical protein ACYC1Q_13255 [Bacteroidia bacterium]